MSNSKPFLHQFMRADGQYHFPDGALAWWDDSMQCWEFRGVSGYNQRFSNDLDLEDYVARTYINSNSISSTKPRIIQGSDLVREAELQTSKPLYVERAAAIAVLAMLDVMTPAQRELFEERFIARYSEVVQDRGCRDEALIHMLRMSTPLKFEEVVDGGG